MEDYRVIAESTIHRGRRLLMNAQGDGFLQITAEALPLPLAKSDFARLRQMRHYRPVLDGLQPTSRRPEPIAVAV